MATQFGTTRRVWSDGNTYWFITLDGRIPNGAVRYKTQQGAQRVAQLSANRAAQHV